MPENKGESANEYLKKLESIDPLSHLVRFERYLSDSTDVNKIAFTSRILNEFPVETFLEMAIEYHKMKANEDAILLLKLSPEHPMVYYWLAYLTEDKSYVDKGNNLSVEQVFPFRLESIPPLEYASKRATGFNTAAYYLSLIHWDRGNIENALSSFFYPPLSDNSDKITYAPIFYTRYLLIENYLNEAPQTKITEKERTELKQLLYKELNRALKLDTSNWRFYQKLSQHFLKYNEPDSALLYAQQAHHKFPDNFAIGMNYAKMLLANKKYDESLYILNKTQVLPFEGAHEGHTVYAQAQLYGTMELIKGKKYKQALKKLDAAREFPENLGVGSPYDPEERMIDYLADFCHRQLKQETQAKAALQKIADYTLSHRQNPNALHYLGIEALRRLGRQNEANLLLEKKLPEFLQTMAVGDR